jgi:hypothetical protein
VNKEVATQKMRALLMERVELDQQLRSAKQKFYKTLEPEEERLEAMDDEIEKLSEILYEGKQP